MSPAPDQDAVAEEINLNRDWLKQYWMLRDLTEAVAEVAGRLFGLTPEGGDRSGTHGTEGTGEVRG